MQICTLLPADNHASTPTTQFVTGRMSFLPPNQQLQSTEGKTTIIYDKIKDQSQTDHILTLTLSVTLTCDPQFQLPASHNSDPHTCKRSRLNVSWKQTDKQMDRGDCIISHANAVNKNHVL